MLRDLATMRDFEIDKNKDSFDIIYKKNKLMEVFETDPDISEILGTKPRKPLNKYKDPENPTEEEKKERSDIEKYNESITHKQIIPYLKINGIQKEVLNFLMFEIRDTGVSNMSEDIKYQYLIVMCLVHEDEMETEYGINRADLLSYLVKDLLCWSNVLGMKLKCESDVDEIIDTNYYCRTLKFRIKTANGGLHPGGNKYDRFSRI